MTLVHNRIGVHGQEVPILTDTLVDIPEDLKVVVKEIKEIATELNNARLELGRLEQVKHHLVNVCNNREENIQSRKKQILRDMQLRPDGNWAIDFELFKIGSVAEAADKPPRVA